MEVNIGLVDRIIRAFLGLILMSWTIGGGPSIAFVFGLIFTATSVYSHCPLYKMIGFKSIWGTKKSE